MELIATQDILNGIKAGDRFEAPDEILVALGFATVAPAVPVDAPELPDAAVPSRYVRRRRTAGESQL